MLQFRVKEIHVTIQLTSLQSLRFYSFYLRSFTSKMIPSKIIKIQTFV